MVIAETATSELRGLLERAIDDLPAGYRLVYVLREIEGLSTAETAAALQIGGQVVKTRLHRARTKLKRNSAHSAARTRGRFPSWRLDATRWSRLFCPRYACHTHPEAATC
jgi:DNA-directed RNA polymerase specialized sigma24 family protein